MSAPPLPDAFGNYALGDFVEVASPAAISWWPQTAGWWWAGAALLAWLTYRVWGLLRRWYRNRYRREATARLQQLAAAPPSGSLVMEINKLLKLTAMAAYSRERVARLSGDNWVGFLNSHCPAAPFSAEQGQILALAAYTGAQLEPPAASQLLTASLAWVQRHESPDHV